MSRQFQSAAFLAVFSLSLSTTGCFNTRGEDFCERQVELSCRMYYQCCNAAERNVIGGGWGIYRTEAECKSENTKLSCGSYAKYSDAVNSGRATWDSGAADSCLSKQDEAVKACDIEDYYDALEQDCEMSDIVQGEVGKGDACYLDIECEDKGRCEVEREDNELTMEGECMRMPQVGDPCDDGECARDLYCEFDGESTCRALKDDGESCDYDSECESYNCDYSDSTCSSLSAQKYDICEGGDRGLFGISFASPALSSGIDLE